MYDDYEFDITYDDGNLKLDRLQDHVSGIVEAVYKTGDVEALESSLEEICAELGVKLGSNKIKLEKIKNIDSASYHLGYQRCQIDLMSRRI